MAKKYTVTRSAFVKQKEHQKVSDGSILMRDWVTIGETHKLEKGKRPTIYGDGNFLFTTNVIQNGQRKQKLSEKGIEWTYDNVKDSKPDANIVRLNNSSDNLSDFAYYGSCVELVRGSVENIIRNFPANIRSTKYKIDNTEYYIVSNPFLIDLHNDSVELRDTDNRLRYLAMSYNDYQVNGADIESYSIEWQKVREENQSLREYNCENNGKEVVTVTVGTAVLHGYMINGDIIFGTSSEDLLIQPKDEIIEKYFESLEGFEKILLNRDSKPLYTNSFMTPVMTETGYRLIPKKYTWVSNGYCIDINSPLYISFIEKLVKTATIFDEEYSDNIVRNMTHEAIKNYDWTYSRKYDEDIEQDNIDGGNRVEKLLRIYGRLFDDIKRYIDGIGFTDKVSYDTYNNKPDAEFTDELEASGWNITSTIPTFEDKDGNNIDMSTVTLKDYETNWYPTKNKDVVSCVGVDNSFMRKLCLNGNRILSSKGTLQSIDMVMALFGLSNDGDNPSYTITERYYTTKPLEYDGNDLDDTLTNAELIAEITKDKTDVVLYDDMYSGVPLKDLNINNEHIIVPYYTDRRMYDGEFTFQSNGGWGKYSDDATKKDDYTETLSYLRVVENVDEMLGLEINSLKKGDIVYMVSTASYVSLLENTDGVTVTNFFILNDDTKPYKLSSWENMTESHAEYKRAKYLDSVVSTLVGNNPHVGYGLYDLGNEYIEYMKKPYKHSIDNHNFNYEIDYDVEDDGEWFDITEKDVTHNLTDTESDDKVILRNTEYKPLKDDYVLNSKYVVFENKIANDLYKEYFKEHILPYVMQVVPSTSILILKGF